MIRQRKSAAERRAEIVAAALALAAEIGLNNTTADAIARRIGVTQPAIFRHFPRKDAMWQAVLEWLDEQLGQVWHDALQQAPAERRVEAVVAAHLGFVARFPAMPLVLLSPELRRTCAAIDQGSGRLIGRFHATLAQAVTDGQDAGRFDAGLAAADAAYMLLAVVQGTALRWAAGGHPFDLAAEGVRLARMAIDGLRK
jgi:AcrR family transcriptional regulator